MKEGFPCYVRVVGCLPTSKLNKVKHSLGQMSDAVKMRHFGSLFIFLFEKELRTSQKMTLQGTNTTTRIKVYLLY